VNDLRKLALAKCAWAVYAAALAAIAPFLLEPFLELLDSLGFERAVDIYGGFLFIAAWFVATTAPLVLLLWRHGIFKRVWQKMTPRGRAESLNQAGLALLGQGQCQDAITRFSEAIRQNPRLAAAHANRGIALMRLNWDRAALDDLDEAIRLDSSSAVTFSWRGELWSKLGNLQSALADHDAAVERKPAQPVFLARRGAVRIQLKDFDRALDDFDAAITIDDPSGDCHFARGSLLFDRREYDRAISDFTEALRRGASRAMVYSNRGMALLATGYLDLAIDDFAEAIRLDPAQALFFNNRGAAHLDRGDYAEALADLNEAIRLTPAFPNSYKNLAWLMATCPDPAYRDGALAVGHCRKAIELTGNKVVEWFAVLAAAYAEAGDFLEAIRWQSKCLVESPSASRTDLESRLHLYESGQPFRLIGRGQ
jgi:tetratricopeptide (TPR) repeat protein